MPTEYKNIKNTLYSIDPGSHTPVERMKIWMSNHLRIVWSFVMMLVLGIFCLWIAFKVGAESKSGTLIENLLPEQNEARPETIAEKAVSPESPESPEGE